MQGFMGLVVYPRWSVLCVHRMHLTNQGVITKFNHARHIAIINDQSWTLRVVSDRYDVDKLRGWEYSHVVFHASCFADIWTLRQRVDLPRALKEGLRLHDKKVTTLKDEPGAWIT